MSPLLQQIRHWAEHTPATIALEGLAERVSYARLWEQVELLAADLKRAKTRHIGLLLDNGPEWIRLQLAALHAGIPLTPIPAFFTPHQQRHALNQSGVDLLLCANPTTARDLDPNFQPTPSVHPLAYHRPCQPTALPQGTRLVTFTSGSTGQPRGVCLGDRQLVRVCRALHQRVMNCDIRRHACLLPLPILLEHLAGALLPLYAGRRCLIYDASATGLGGSSSLDLQRFGCFIHHHQPESLILTPELLKALLCLCRAGLSTRCFKLLAVGGARVPSALLQQAAALGLPVAEGYGLSECASVVALDTPGQPRPGSCGRPLDHCRVSIADNGEVLVHDAAMLGYVGDRQPPGEPLHTGDLGYLDEEGFLHIQGRLKNVFINSFGRNFSPEWIEAEFAGAAEIQQLCLFGDQRPYNVALLSPRIGASHATLQSAIDRINATLPDYARISRWLLLEQPFTAANGLLTANGRLRRNAIAQVYGDAIDRLYHPAKESRHHAIL